MRHKICLFSSISLSSLALWCVVVFVASCRFICSLKPFYEFFHFQFYTIYLQHECSISLRSVAPVWMVLSSDVRVDIVSFMHDAQMFGGHWRTVIWLDQQFFFSTFVRNTASHILCGCCGNISQCCWSHHAYGVTHLAATMKFRTFEELHITIFHLYSSNFSFAHFCTLFSHQIASAPRFRINTPKMSYCRLTPTLSRCRSTGV